VWRTTVYDEADVLFDLLDRSAAMLRQGGCLVYLYPALRAGHTAEALPQHPCLAMETDGEEPLTGLLSRRIVCMVKVAPHDARRRGEYRAHHDAAAARAGTLGKSIKQRLGEAYEAWFGDHGAAAGIDAAAGGGNASDGGGGGGGGGGDDDDGSDDDDAAATDDASGDGDATTASADAQHWAAVRRAVALELGLSGKALVLHVRRLRRQVRRRQRGATGAAAAAAAESAAVALPT
jgi:hypothetical protein